MLLLARADKWGSGMFCTAVFRLCLVAGLISAPVTVLAGDVADNMAHDLNGDWLGFPLTQILRGDMVPVFEHLRIDGNRATSRGWAVPMNTARCTGEADSPACAPPVEIGAVRIERPEPARPGLLRIQRDGPQTNPMTHPDDVLAWLQSALAGAEWQSRSAERFLVLSREAVVQGASITVERVYLRAAPETAGHVFDYLRATDVSLGRSVCALLAIHELPELWDAFTDRIATMAPVTAKLRRWSDLAAPERADTLRMVTLRQGPEALGAQAADVSDLPETARAAWLAMAARTGGQGGDGGDLLHLTALGLDLPEQVGARSRACIDGVFGH